MTCGGSYINKGMSPHHTLNKCTTQITSRLCSLYPLISKSVFPVIWIPFFSNTQLSDIVFHMYSSLHQLSRYKYSLNMLFFLIKSNQFKNLEIETLLTLTTRYYIRAGGKCCPPSPNQLPSRSCRNRKENISEAKWDNISFNITISPLS